MNNPTHTPYVHDPLNDPRYIEAIIRPLTKALASLVSDPTVRIPPDVKILARYAAAGWVDGQGIRIPPAVIEWLGDASLAPLLQTDRPPTFTR